MDKIDQTTLRTLFVAAVGVLAIAGTWNRQDHESTRAITPPSASSALRGAQVSSATRSEAEASSVPAGAAATPSTRRRAARRDAVPRTPQSSRQGSASSATGVSTPLSSAPRPAVSSPSVPSVSSRRAREVQAGQTASSSTQQTRGTPDPGVDPLPRADSVQRTLVRSPARQLAPSGGQDGASDLPAWTGAGTGTGTGTGTGAGTAGRAAPLTPMMEQGEDEEGNSDDDDEGYDDSDASIVSDDGDSLVVEEAGPPMVTLPALPQGSVGYVSRERSTHPWLARVRVHTDSLSGDAVAILAILVAAYAVFTCLCTLTVLSPLIHSAWDRGLLGYLWAILGPAVGLLVGAQLARGSGGGMPPNADGPLLVPASQAFPSPSSAMLKGGMGVPGPGPGDGQGTSTPQGTRTAEAEDPTSLHSRGSSAQLAFRASGIASGSGRGQGMRMQGQEAEGAEGGGRPTDRNNLGSPQLAGGATLHNSVARTLQLPPPDDTEDDGNGDGIFDVPAQVPAADDKAGAIAAEVGVTAVQSQAEQFMKAWRSITAHVDVLLSVPVPGPNPSSCPYIQAESMLVDCLQALGYAHGTCQGFMQGLDVAEGANPYATVKAPPVPTFPLPAPASEAHALLKSTWDETAWLRIGDTAAVDAAAVTQQASTASAPLALPCTGRESVPELRRIAVADLLWRRAQVGDIRGNAMLAVKVPVQDQVGNAILAAAGSDRYAASLSVFRRSLISVRHALVLHEPIQSAHKWAMILQSKCHGGDTKAKIAGGFQLKAHGERAVALDPSDPLAQHAMGVWCYEVAGLNWVTRRVATALFGEPPAATYDQALAYFDKVEGLIKDRSSEFPLLLFANRLKLAQCWLAKGDEGKGKGWVGQALDGPSVAAQLEESRRVEVREMAKRLQVAIPPAWQ